MRRLSSIFSLNSDNYIWEPIRRDISNGDSPWEMTLIHRNQVCDTTVSIEKRGPHNFISLGYTFGIDCTSNAIWRDKDITKLADGSISWRANLGEDEKGIRYFRELSTSLVFFLIVQKCIVVNGSYDAFGISYWIDIKHINHSISVNIGEIEHISNVIWNRLP